MSDYRRGADGCRIYELGGEFSRECQAAYMISNSHIAVWRMLDAARDGEGAVVSITGIHGVTLTYDTRGPGKTIYSGRNMYPDVFW